MTDNAKNSAHVVSTTDATFDVEVIERSKLTPVVVDFWATWCGPCRALGPVLEGLAGEYEGRFLLAKAETDFNSEAAGKFGVSSIPAVFGVVDGKVVDQFVGALPERHIRAWLDRLLEDGELSQLIQLAETVPDQAEAKLAAAQLRNPNDVRISIALARAYLAQGKADACRELLAKLEKRGFLEPEAEMIKAKLELQGMRSEGLDDLRRAAESRPSDLEAQLQFGKALAADQRFEEALECLIPIVPKDRKGLGEAARLVVLDIFRVLPPDSPLLSTYRRKLSTALY